MKMVSSGNQRQLLLHCYQRQFFIVVLNGYESRIIGSERTEISLRHVSCMYHLDFEMIQNLGATYIGLSGKNTKIKQPHRIIKQ